MTWRQTSALVDGSGASDNEALGRGDAEISHGDSPIMINNSLFNPDHLTMICAPAHIRRPSIQEGNEMPEWYLTRVIWPWMLRLTKLDLFCTVEQGYLKMFESAILAVVDKVPEIAKKQNKPKSEKCNLVTLQDIKSLDVTRRCAMTAYLKMIEGGTGT